MTVRRRFKTLMMRKKQRQSEREEAEASKKIAWMGRDDPEGSNLSRSPQTVDTTRDGDVIMFDKVDTNKSHIDLNFHPGNRGEEQHIGQPRVSMVSLLEVANRPLESYMKQNGLVSLAVEQGNSGTAPILPQPAPMESEERPSDEGQLTLVERERDPADNMAVDEAADENQGNAVSASDNAAA
jgi:hypothetical protein